MSFLRTRFIQKFLHWRFFLIANIFLCLLVGISLGREILRHQALQKEIEALTAQAQLLGDDNVQMNEVHSALQSESYIEREARLKLGLKKPGETLIVIQESVEGMVQEGTLDAADPLDLVLDQEEPQEPLANSTKWWYYFFNKSAFKALQTYSYESR